MIDNTFVQALYVPQQPTEGIGRRGALCYQEYAPGQFLKPYIACYWKLYSPYALDASYSYRVVADGCVDLLINECDFDGMELAGTANSASQIPLQGLVSYFGIRFLPGFITHFFRLSAKDIANRMLPAEVILGQQLGDLPQRLFECNNTSQRVALAESYLLRRLRQSTVDFHPGFGRALYRILVTNGKAPIETEVAEWISPRQLLRLFNDRIGFPPKVFSKIVRFQHVLRVTRQVDKKYWSKLNCDYGYFDQAHFIREFSLFYGQTPYSATLKTPISGDLNE